LDQNVLKYDFSALRGGALTTSPVNYAQMFSPPWGARTPSAPPERPGCAYGVYTT